MEDDWGDDGLTYKSDPTQLKETGENPVPSTGADSEEASGEDGNLLNP
jgi:hypothetical protein